MPSWLIPVFTALLVAVVGAYTVVPRVNARVKSVEAMHDQRLEFKRRLRTIVATCTRLTSTDGVTTADEQTGDRLAAERERWLGQLDEHTIWLVDNVEFYALTYPGLARARETIARYAMVARMTLLSAKPEAERIGVVAELTGLLLTVVDPDRRRPTAWKAALDQLVERMNQLEKPSAGSG